MIDDEGVCVVCDSESGSGLTLSSQFDQLKLKKDRVALIGQGRSMRSLIGPEPKNL